MSKENKDLGLIMFLPLVIDLFHLLSVYPHKVYYLDETIRIYNTRFDYLIVFRDHFLICLLCLILFNICSYLYEQGYFKRRIEK